MQLHPHNFNFYCKIKTLIKNKSITQSGPKQFHASDAHTAFNDLYLFQTQNFVLFEHAAGYALFKVKEFEEVGTFLQQVEASVTELSRFNSVVKLIGFSPFKTAANALENINAVSEGIVTDDLHVFLEAQLPKQKKQGKVVLGKF